MEPPWWRRPSTLPLVLAVMALLIVIVGGSIRINDAGESCPEWPTCFGTWHFVVSEEAQGAYWDANPDQIDSRGEDHRYTVFQIFVEWFHRMLVGVIALPIVYNVVAMRKHRDHYGTPVERAAQFSALLLVIQATAGYVTVRYDNADWTVALHLSLACIFISGLLWQHLSMRITEGVEWRFLQAPRSFVDAHWKRVHSMTAAVGLLLVLGAWVSSSAGGQYNQELLRGFPRRMAEVPRVHSSFAGRPGDLHPNDSPVRGLARRFGARFGPQQPSNVLRASIRQRPTRPLRRIHDGRLVVQRHGRRLVHRFRQGWGFPGVAFTAPFGGRRGRIPFRCVPDVCDAFRSCSHTETNG